MNWAAFRGDKRGQTLQDFALGISLFLITVTFVFGLFPSYLEPFTAGTDDSDQMRADRLSRALIQEHATAKGGSVLNGTKLSTTLAQNQSQLRSEYGFTRAADINVTVREGGDDSLVSLNGSSLATDQDSQNQPAAARARIVRLSNETVCEPSCRLVVKVW